jgi:hypothetical protein
MEPTPVVRRPETYDELVKKYLRTGVWTKRFVVYLPRPPPRTPSPLFLLDFEDETTSIVM